MTARIECSGLSVARELYDLIRDEIAPGTGVDPDHFWTEYAKLLEDLVPANRFLLEKRDLMHHQFTTADLDQQLRVRAVFDPTGMLNRGKVFPLDARIAGDGEAKPLAA